MTQYHLHLKGYVGGADFNTESVLATLAANPDAEVSVLVDSTGGQLATALLPPHVVHFRNLQRLFSAFPSCKMTETRFFVAHSSLLNTFTHLKHRFSSFYGAKTAFLH